MFSSIPTSVTLSEIDPEIAEFSGSMIRLTILVTCGCDRSSTGPSPRRWWPASNKAYASGRSISWVTSGRPPDGHADSSSPSRSSPLQIICDMMGIPEEDEAKVFHWTSVMLGAGDDEIAGSFDGSPRVGPGHGRVRCAVGRGPPSTKPGDDLTTNLVQAEVDGERLSVSSEIASFFILLTDTGNETTRNAISHGMVTLTRYPDERAKWWSDFDGVAATAVKEIVRWATPVILVRRNLTEDMSNSAASR